MDDGALDTLLLQDVDRGSLVLSEVIRFESAFSLNPEHSIAAMTMRPNVDNQRPPKAVRCIWVRA
jgi:hypothetical protein